MSYYFQFYKDAPVEKRSTILSVMETMFGLGMMIGPFIGGLLYEVDGFYFPFVICGGSLLICALISCFFVKSIPSENGGIAEDEMTKSVKFKQLLKIPSISICCFLLINAQMSVTWYMVNNYIT